jgi:hypothetical protein
MNEIEQRMWCKITRAVEENSEALALVSPDSRSAIGHYLKRSDIFVEFWLICNNSHLGGHRPLDLLPDGLGEVLSAAAHESEPSYHG